MPKAKKKEGFLDSFESEWKRFRLESKKKVKTSKDFIQKYPFVATGLAFFLGYFLGSMRRRR